jgi:hypothetical protein
MKRKVRRIAAALADRLSLVDAVRAVLLGEAAEIETFDPYFTIDLDVYTLGSTPDMATRRSYFPEVGAFEVSPVAAVDRFRVDDLPVSVHWVRCADVDRLLLRIAELSWVWHEPGTNPLYRIEHGEVIFSRDGWLEESRAALAHVPSDFWIQARLRSLALAERALVDLSAAAHREDRLFFLVSAARFVRCVASFLFVANRQFEPSDRMLGERIPELARLPDGIKGRLEILTRPVHELSMEKRREVGEQIVASLVPLTTDEGT